MKPQLYPWENGKISSCQSAEKPWRGSYGKKGTLEMKSKAMTSQRRKGREKSKENPAGVVVP